MACRLLQFLKVRSGSIVKCCGKDTLARALHPLNRLVPIWLSCCGSATEVSFWQSRKASLPMLARVSGSCICARFLQLRKASSPICCRPWGSVMVCRAVQFRKAPFAMLVADCGTATAVWRPSGQRSTVVSALSQSSPAASAYVALSSSTAMLVSLWHPSKALVLSFPTAAGIRISCRALPAKARESICTMPAGRLSCLMPV